MHYDNYTLNQTEELIRCYNCTKLIQDDYYCIVYPTDVPFCLKCSQKALKEHENDLQEDIFCVKDMLNEIEDLLKEEN